MAPFEDKSEKAPNEGQNATPDNTPQDENAAPATPPAPVSRVVEMPTGGLQGLARNLYPDDVEDSKKMSQHVADLFDLNRDTLRNDTEYRAHQLVRVA